MPIGKKKDELAELCAGYEKAEAALIDFKQANRRVFTKLAELEEQKELVAKTIKDKIRATHAKKTGEQTVYSGAVISVVVQPKRDREFNIETLTERLGPDIQEKVLKHTVDLKAWDALVEEGTITDEDVNAVVSRTPGTPAVCFRLQTAKKEGE